MISLFAWLISLTPVTPFAQPGEAGPIRASSPNCREINKKP